MDTTNRDLPARRALYLQVYDILSRRIIGSQIAEGEFLPNEFELSREFQVSIGTIRKAVDLLTEANLVIRQQGKGTYVCDRRWIDVRNKVNRIRFGDDASLAGWSYTEIEYAIRPADLETAKRLQIAEGDDVHLVHRTRRCEPHSVVEERIFIPVSTVADLAVDEKGRRSTVTTAKVNAISIGSIDERLSAVAATPSLAGILSVEVGAPLMRMVRVLYDVNGAPIEYRVSHCHTDEGYYWCAQP